MKTNKYHIADSTEDYINNNTENRVTIFKLLNKLKTVKKKTLFVDKKERKVQKLDLKKQQQKET